MTYQNPNLAFNEAKAEAFAERFVGTLNEAALAIMTSRTPCWTVRCAWGQPRPQFAGAFAEGRCQRTLPA